MVWSHFSGWLTHFIPNNPEHPNLFLFFLIQTYTKLSFTQIRRIKFRKAISPQIYNNAISEAFTQTRA